MHALVVYCHPNPESFTAAVRDTVVSELSGAGATVDVIDLYGDGFDAVMTPGEYAHHFDTDRNRAPVEDQVRRIEAADTLIFVYPTWWYGMPAMLKGWLDRALLPGVAFLMPDAENAENAENADIRPGMTHIRRLAVYTTCGASWWLTRLVGAPGKRTILTGVRLLCHSRVRTGYAAHYSMDSSTQDSRTRHLGRVAKSVRRLVGSGKTAIAEAPA